MLTAAAVPELGSVLLAFTVNLAAIIIFAVLMFFRRYTKPGLTVVFVFFNVGLFAVVTVIMRTEINAAVGFGLFAMLSIIRLRSDPFSPREIGYFFGALALGLVNGLGPPDAFTLVLNVAILGTMYVVDHPRLFVVPPSLDVTFDRVIADPVELRRRLEERLGVHVREVTVSSIDYVRDIMELKVQYLPTGRIKGGTSSRGTSSLGRSATGLAGPYDQPTTRGTRTVRPSPAPLPSFQPPASARVAAPVAGAVARPTTSTEPRVADPALPPTPQTEPRVTDPALTPTARTEPPVGEPSLPEAAVSPTAGPESTTPTADPTAGAEPQQSPDPVPSASSDTAARRPVFAPLGPPASDSARLSPVFAPGAGPHPPRPSADAESSATGTSVSVSAPVTRASESPDAEASGVSEIPEDEHGDRPLREKVLGTLSSWIVS